MKKRIADHKCFTDSDREFLKIWNSAKTRTEAQIIYFGTLPYRECTCQTNLGFNCYCTEKLIKNFNAKVTRIRKKVIMAYAGDWRKYIKIEVQVLR